MRYLSLVLLPCLAVFCFGCGSKDDSGTDTSATQVKQTFETAAKTTTDFAAEKKDAFLKQMKSNIQALNNQMETLEKKGENLSGEAKSRWETTMKDLQKQKEALKEQLKKAGSVSSNEWKNFSRDFSNAYNKFKEGLKNAVGEFNK